MAQESIQKIPVICILGSGHCGSTLLDLLLDTHPNMLGMGEIENVWNDPSFGCTCGNPVSACRVWAQKAPMVKDRFKIARTKSNALLGRNVFYHPITRMPVDHVAYMKETEELFEHVQKHGHILVDSSKNADRVKALSLSKKIQPYVIHLVRDGRANTWSYMRKYSQNLHFFLQWFLTNLKIERLKLEIPVPTKIIHYDSFVKDPKKALKEIAEWVKAENTFNTESFREEEHHQIGGNRLRFSSSNEIRQDNAWKKDMPLKWRIYFNIVFGWLNLYYRLRA